MKSIIANIAAVIVAAHQKDGHERQKAYFSLDGANNLGVSLTVGPDTDVTVEAQENRSTGFSWYITKNTCDYRFEMTKDVYIPHPYQEGDD